jgi:signal transduction histidine kinase
MGKKPTYKEIEQRVKDLEKESLEHKNTEERLDEQNKYNKLRAEIWKVAADKSLTETALIQKLLDTIGPAVDVSRAAFLRFDPERREYVVEISWNKSEFGSTKGVTIPYDLAKHYIGRDYVEIPRDMLAVVKPFALATMKRFGIKSFLAVPCGSDKIKPDRVFTFSDCEKNRKWSDLEKSVLFEVIKIVSTRVEQIKVEEEKLKLEERLHQSQKLEAIGALAGGIAHDFNNLLSTIIGYISMIKNSFSLDDYHYRMLENAETTSIKAADLANQLITFSEGGWLFKKEVSFLQILNEAKNRLPADMAITFDIDIPNKLQLIDGDEDKLIQVIFNLLWNALEAMPGEKKIFIRAENRTITAKDNLPIPEGQYVKVLIEDQGIGISRENLEKIFDPYFSTKQVVSQRGMGLGLSICFSIIKKHGGDISVESEVGKGTIVRLYLPAVPGKR